MYSAQGHNRVELNRNLQSCFILLFFLFSGRPIFSIDIHPDGSRVATGGQGNKIDHK